MAGTGRAPKAASERRNRGTPQRGDWLELQPPTRKKAPIIPSRGKGRGNWSPRTRAAWKSWWMDPASTQWGEGDRDLVLHLADIYEEWVRDPTASFASEIRQLRDSLGLTPKGRQDRRWMLKQAEVHDVDEQREKKPASKRRHLRAVDPAAAAKA